MCYRAFLGAHARTQKANTRRDGSSRLVRLVPSRLVSRSCGPVFRGPSERPTGWMGAPARRDQTDGLDGWNGSTLTSSSAHAASVPSQGCARWNLGGSQRPSAHWMRCQSGAFGPPETALEGAPTQWASPHRRDGPGATRNSTASSCAALFESPPTIPSQPGLAVEPSIILSTAPSHRRPGHRRRRRHCRRHAGMPAILGSLSTGGRAADMLAPRPRATQHAATSQRQLPINTTTTTTKASPPRRGQQLRHAANASRPLCKRRPPRRFSGSRSQGRPGQAQREMDELALHGRCIARQRPKPRQSTPSTRRLPALAPISIVHAICMHARGGGVPAHAWVQSHLAPLPSRALWIPPKPLASLRRLWSAPMPPSPFDPAFPIKAQQSPAKPSLVAWFVCRPSPWLLLTDVSTCSPARQPVSLANVAPALTPPWTSYVDRRNRSRRGPRVVGWLVPPSAGPTSIHPSSTPSRQAHSPAPPSHMSAGTACRVALVQPFPPVLRSIFALGGGASTDAMTGTMPCHATPCTKLSDR